MYLRKKYKNVYYLLSNGIMRITSVQYNHCRGEHIESIDDLLDRSLHDF